MKVTFELSDKDLAHFRQIMREVRERNKNTAHADILANAEEMLRGVRAHETPSFVTERLEKLQLMIDMINDEEWELPADARSRGFQALSYFSDPEDLIPDHVPGMGFLDDAIMVELVVRELGHEIDAYVDFRAFRSYEEQRRRERGEPCDVTRDEWLTARRQTLHSRMRRRRRRDKGGLLNIFGRR